MPLSVKCTGIATIYIYSNGRPGFKVTTVQIAIGVQHTGIDSDVIHQNCVDVELSVLIDFIGKPVQLRR